jgi:HAD superfamily hydrolase (TIGR01549 family)
MPRGGFQGAIFDVDGVLVDSPHERAWKDSLRELMETEWSDIRDRSEWSDDKFTPQVYQQVMSGKPRMAGALAGLEYFKVPDAPERVQAYADRKQYDFLRPGFMLIDIFDKNLSGRDFAHGKPDPEIFVTAAAELGVEPENCFVVEDAVSGIQAAKAGAMAALGVARADDQDALAAADADLVVTSLDEVDVAGVSRGELTSRSA